MNSYIKENWTEDEILALSISEHDYFDRKSGKGIEKTKSNSTELSKFKTELGKDLSAFANSGGGHLIFGVEDDGNIDGVEEIYKNAERTREWLEKIIPNLTNYPLRDFRVHEVSPSISTQIPKDKTIIVIDIGDSKLAPHQTAETKIYYHRAGSQSLPAGHHYISLMFGRSRFPSKEIAESWKQKVINPLLDFFNWENKSLNEKKRFWKLDEYFYYSRVPEVIIPIINNDKIYDLDIFEQFSEFTPQLQELISSHDKIIKRVGEQFLKLFQEIRRLPFLVEKFRELTENEKLQMLLVRNPHLQQYKDNLFTEFFKDAKEEKILDDFAILIVNKLKRLEARVSYQPFWNKESEQFISLLQFPPLFSYNDQIDKSYEELLQINVEIVSLLKKRRSEISVEYGIPVR